MIAYGLEWHTLDTYFSFNELSAAPETPESGMLRLYAKDNGAGVSQLCYKNDAGTEVCFPTSGSFISGAGTDNQVAIWNGTSAIDAFNATAGSVFFAGAGGILAQDNANLFWNDTNNRLGIGMAAPIAVLDVRSANHGGAAGTGAIALVGTTNQERIEAVSFGTGNAPGFQFVHAEGTIASPTATVLDSFLGFIGGSGYDNAGTPARIISNRALIGMKAAENYTTGAQGAYITFEVVAAGSTTRTERWRLNSAGFLTAMSTGSYIDLTAVTTRVLKVPTDNTDPTGGGGAATGRIPIHDAAGNLRYIPYY